MNLACGTGHPSYVMGASFANQTLAQIEPDLTLLTERQARYIGGAGPDEFRTAPLWGVGQRVFFLHDGRTTDLVKAIEAHNSRGSEASTIIERFNGLSTAQQQDIVNFLRSL